MFIVHLLWSKNCARRDSERTWIRYLPWRVSILIAGREGRKIRKQSDDERYSRSMCVMLWTLNLSGKVKSMVSLENNTRRENLPEIDHRPKHKSKNCKTSQRKQTFVIKRDIILFRVIKHYLYRSVLLSNQSDKTRKVKRGKRWWRTWKLTFSKV